MTRMVTTSDAKARLSEWINVAANGQPVVITRHGKAVVAMVPIDDLEQLNRLRAAGPEAGLLSLAGGWEGSGDLVDGLDAMRRTPPRALPEM